MCCGCLVSPAWTSRSSCCAVGCPSLLSEGFEAPSPAVRPGHGRCHRWLEPAVPQLPELPGASSPSPSPSTRGRRLSTRREKSPLRCFLEKWQLRASPPYLPPQSQGSYTKPCWQGLGVGSRLFPPASLGWLWLKAAVASWLPGSSLRMQLVALSPRGFECLTVKPGLGCR